MNPTRVYLDHKDYANMTKGLLGNAQHRPDVEWYDTLRRLVSEGRMICVFSAMHVVEAIRSSDDAWLKAYADVVDNLTEGHCLIFRPELERRELAHFIGREFGPPSGLRHPDLAFGRGFAAFLDPEEELSRALDELPMQVQNSVSETLSAQRLNRKQRRAIAARQPALLTKLVSPRDAEAPNLPPAVVDMLREPRFASQLLTGPRENRRRLLRKLMDRSMTFGSILPFYKSLYPDLARIGTLFDDSARGIIDTIRAHRDLHQILSQLGHEVDFADVRRRIVANIAHHLAAEVRGGDIRSRVAPDDLANALINKDLNGIPSWEAAVLLYMHYLRSNTGPSTRKLQESDMRDIVHLTHAPYVDYLLTDRYFAATIAHSLSGRFPQAVILRNASELCDRLYGARGTS